MATDKTVHLIVKLPELLGEQIERTAKSENKTADQFVQEAVERQLLMKRHQALQKFGHSKAKESGITESEVPGLIAESRNEAAKRGR